MTTPRSSLQTPTSANPKGLQTTFSGTTLTPSCQTSGPTALRKGRRPSDPVSVNRKTTSKDTLWQLALCVLSLALFAIIVLFVQTSKYAQQDSDNKRQLADILRTNASLTLAVLRTAQAVLSTITMFGLDTALEYVQWTLMNSPRGLPFPSLLALSPATGQIGMLQLFFSDGALISARLWTLLRGGLTFSIWLSGIILFYNTDLKTVYDTAYTYPVSAGVGPFNATLVEPFTSFLQGLSPTYPYTVLPYTYYAAAYTLVLNPLIATIAEPVACTAHQSCMSYLFTGGLSMVAPWVPSKHVDYPMIKVDDAPAVQMDFSGVLEVDMEPFQEENCDVFGDDETIIGIKLCVEEERLGAGTETGVLRAGLFLCNGTQGGTTCNSYAHGKSLNITTRLSMYTRRTTFVAARSNYSIVSVAQSASDTTEKIADIDLPSYRAALTWLLNYTAAAVPAPSSIAESFWSSNLQLGDPSTYGVVTQNFQSLLAFPTWLFNMNNWGNTALKSNVTVPGMPDQFYTTAGVVKPVSTYDFDSAMFGLFVGLQGVAMVFIWGVLFWVWCGRRDLPETSSFPLFDLKYRTVVAGDERLTNDGELVRASGSEVVGYVNRAVVRTREFAQQKTFDGPPPGTVGNSKP